MNKLFGQTIKEAAKTATKKAVSTAVTKTGEYAGKKARDKIIELLQRNKKETPIIATQQKKHVDTPLTDYEINERVNQLISGGKLRKMK